jgi:hypothetical protein
MEAHKRYKKDKNNIKSLVAKATLYPIKTFGGMSFTKKRKLRFYSNWSSCSLSNLNPFLRLINS